MPLTGPNRSFGPIPGVGPTAAAGPLEGETAYSSSGADQQELVDRYPGLAAKSDRDLIELVAAPPAGVALMGDVDEVQAVAAILLERRLSAALAA
jgi:hypothetical protein